MVTGSLTVADDVDPQVLANRLDKVHNFGEIRATTAQIAAMQARLGANEGEFVDTTTMTDDVDAEAGIGNVAYLKL